MWPDPTRMERGARVVLRGLEKQFDGPRVLRGLDASIQQAYRVLPSGASIASDDVVEDFSVRNLGFQVRYRYEIAPLSYLYVVYGRGGYQQDPFTERASDLLRDSLDLRDDEQLMVKLSYRFEL